MLHLLDDALEGLLRAGLPFGRDDVEVTFAAPTSEWSAALTRPTVNLFLWSVGPSPDEMAAGMELVEHDGRLVRRPALPRLACSYLVTVWATDPRDEHQLLAALLAIVISTPEMPRQHLAGLLSGVGPPPRLTITKSDDRRSVELWSAIGSRLRPSLDLVVTATLEAAAVAVAGPPVTTHELVVTAGEGTDERRVVTGSAPGASPGTVVRTPRGTARVRTDGRFAVPARPGDIVVVESEPPAEASIPEHGPVRVE